MSAVDHIRCQQCRTPNDPGALFCGRCGASLTGSIHGGVRRRQGRVTAAGVAMGFALFLILLATTFILGFIIYRTLELGEAVDPYVARSGTTASIVADASDNPGGGSDGSGSGGSDNPSSTAAAMLIRASAASASSVLKATTTSNFRPPNLLDGDLTTAWIEGEEGPGSGEWARFDFSEPVVLDHLEIANGYQKDDDRFFSHARVKSLKVEYSNGATQLVELLDTKDLQSVTTTHRATEWIKLTIVSVYPDYEWEDAALSEVRVYASPDEQ
jgi:hypothetical protein